MIRAPLLDDIAFDELFEQGRSLIPRFAPQWTDHNVHDPGITILDLMSWLVDIQAYRIGFIGSAYFTAFAALLGVQAKTAEPARGLLWPTRSLPPIQIRRGSAATTAGSPDVPFRVELDVDLSPAQGHDAILRQPDGAAVFVRLDQRIPLKAGDRLDLKFDRPLTTATGTRVALGVELERNQGTSDRSWGPVFFDYGVEGEPGWQPVTIIHDGTASLSRSGVFVLDIPPASSGRTILRLRLDQAFFPVSPTFTAVGLNVLPVEQVKHEDSEVLGRGSGQPDQLLPINWTGLLAGDPYSDLTITSDEDGTLHWNEVDDLSSCGPTDTAYVRDVARGAIRFGNGLNGRNPGEAALIRVGEVDRTLGAAGNLAKKQLWRVSGLSGDFGFNRERMTGGRDADSLEDLLDAIKLKAIDRKAMVTNREAQVAARALRGFGIERADVIPRYWPDLPRHSLCGARTLILRPEADATPPRTFLESVAAELEPCRVLGERLFIITPTLVPVRVDATAVIESGDENEIRKAIETRLLARLSDRKTAPEIEPWPLGRILTIGELESLIASTEGVSAAVKVRIAKSAEPLASEAIVLAPDEIAVLSAERLDVHFAREVS